MSTLYTDDDWLTPPEIIRALGPFDLDPSTPLVRPWDTAAHHYNLHDDGLSQPWFGRVWLNPPYSKRNNISQVELWLGRLAAHGSGTALTNSRTETAWFFDHIWNSATAVLFPRSRITFLRPDGTKPDHGRHPNVLAAYSDFDAQKLLAAMQTCKPLRGGKFIPLIIRFVPDVKTSSWREIVRYFLRDLGGVATREQLYELAAGHPKTAGNPNFKAKIRQQVQAVAQRVGPATWQQNLSLT